MEKGKIVYKAKLWPLFEKYISDPLFKFVPWGLPANFITIIGNVCLALSSLTAWYASRGAVWLWPLIPLFVYAYLTGDCLDGKQARRTGTSSPLGNFLDHFFDILCPLYILSALCFAYRIEEPLATALIIVGGCLPLFGTYYEQYYTGVMYFEAFSAFEYITLSTFLTCLGLNDAWRNFVARELFLGLSVFDAALIIAAAGAILTFINNTVRAFRTGKKRYYLFVPLIAPVAFFASRLYSGAGSFVIAGLYCASYAERFMLAFVKEKREPVPDFIFPVLLGGVWLLAPDAGAALALPFAYQGLSIAALFVYGFVPLRSGWVWLNKGKGISGKEQGEEA
jgi:phosphatidylglycerophosphate synthase